MVALNIGPRESIDPEPLDLVAAWSRGGVLAAILMAIAWCVFTDAKWGGVNDQGGRRHRENLLMISTASLLAVIHAGSLGVTAVQLRDLVAGGLLALAGCLVTWFLMRNYFRLRIVPSNQDIRVSESRSDVSIRKLMLLTSVFAGLMGAGRVIVGDLDGRLAMLLVAGCLLGLQWWATAIWLLGRHRYFVVTILAFVLVQLVVATGVWKQDVASSGELVISASILTGVQMHLVLFLAIMRASQYRLQRLGIIKPRSSCPNLLSDR